MGTSADGGSTARFFSTILRKEGALGLWRGNGLAVARATMQKGLLFATQDSLRTSCGSDAFAGGAAGLAAAGVTYPLDLLRTRLAGQVDAGSLVTLVRESVAARGPLALFAGASATMMGGVVFESIRFGTYGWLMRAAPQDERGTAVLGPAMNGVAASLLAGNIIYPNDTVRRRLQMIGGSRETYRQACESLYCEGGVRRLYKGFFLYNLKALPSAFVQFATFHQLKRMLSGKRQ